MGLIKNAIEWLIHLMSGEVKNEKETKRVSTDAKIDEIEIRAIDAEATDVTKESFTEEVTIELDEEEMEVESDYEQQEAGVTQQLSNDEAEFENLNSNYQATVQSETDSLTDEDQALLDETELRGKEIEADRKDQEAQLKKQKIKVSGAEDQNTKPFLNINLVYGIMAVIIVVAVPLNNQVLALVMDNIPAAGLILAFLLGILDAILAHTIGKAFGFGKRVLAVILSLVASCLLSLVIYGQTIVAENDRIYDNIDLAITTTDNITEILPTPPIVEPDAAPLDGVLPFSDTGFLQTQIKKHPFIASILVVLMFITASALSYGHYKDVARLQPSLVLKQMKVRLSKLTRQSNMYSNKLKHLNAGFQKKAVKKVDKRIDFLGSRIQKNKSSLEQIKHDREKALRALSKRREKALNVINRIFGDDNSAAA